MRGKRWCRSCCWNSRVWPNLKKPNRRRSNCFCESSRVFKTSRLLPASFKLLIKEKKKWHSIFLLFVGVKICRLPLFTLEILPQKWKNVHHGKQCLLLFILHYRAYHYFLQIDSEYHNRIHISWPFSKFDQIHNYWRWRGEITDICFENLPHFLSFLTFNTSVLLHELPE